MFVELDVCLGYWVGYVCKKFGIDVCYYVMLGEY